MHKDFVKTSGNGRNYKDDWKYTLKNAIGPSEEARLTVDFLVRGQFFSALRPDPQKAKDRQYHRSKHRSQKQNDAFAKRGPTLHEREKPRENQHPRQEEVGLQNITEPCDPRTNPRFAPPAFDPVRGPSEEGQVFFLQCSTLGFIAQKLKVTARVVPPVKDHEGGEAHEHPDWCQYQDNVRLLTVSVDESVGKQALSDQEPHDAVINHVVFVPDHLADDGWIEARLGVIHHGLAVHSNTWHCHGGTSRYSPLDSSSSPLR